MIHFLLSLTLLAFTTTGMAPHPYHVSRAEIQYNAQRGTFEVALCVWPDDLEKVIQDDKKSVVLDKLSEQERDQLISDYVSKKFRVCPSPSAQPKTTPTDSKTAAPPEKKEVPSCSIRWVGSEVALKQAWLYFEIDAGKKTKQWSFENRMFFELNDDQQNQIQIQTQAQTIRRRGRGGQLFSRTLSAVDPTATWAQKAKADQ